MAISLTSDGLNLNYPTSVQEGQNLPDFPIGCVVVFHGSGHETWTSGTWLKIQGNAMMDTIDFSIGSALFGKGDDGIGIRIA